MMPDAELALDLDLPQSLRVVSCRIREGMSSLTHAELEVSSLEHLDLERAIAAPAVVELALGSVPTRRWTLRVAEVDFLRTVDGTLRYRLSLYPALWLLGLTIDTRKFRLLSAEQIVGQVLAAHAVGHRFALTRPTETRKYCVQYRESDLDFVLRLLEFEGIHYTFEDDGTLLFADRSQDGAPIEGPGFFELTEAAGTLQWGAPGIHELRKERAVASGRATVNDFDWKRPKVGLLASAAAAEDGELEVYDCPTGFRRPDQGARLARTRLEALRVGALDVTGAGNVPGFAPGRAFTFGALAGSRFAGEYVLLGVDHRYHDRRFRERALPVADVAAETEALNYRNHFRALPKDQPFRPALATAHPHVSGCHTAMVRGPAGEEIHTDRYGRFRAQFHWDREARGSDEDSRWLRVLQETQTGLVLSRVGWEYSVAYIDGDPDRPIGLARNINGVMTPEYGQPANKTRMTVKTPTYPSNGTFNELRLEDAAGRQHFDWTAERDHTSDVVNDRDEAVGNDEQSSCGASRSHGVTNDQSVTIGGDHELDVGHDDGNVVRQDRQESIGGDEKVAVTQVFSEICFGDETEKVGGDRKSEAGKERGGLGRTVAENLERKVGGSSTSKGKGDISLLVQEKLAECVGGSKVTRVQNGGLASVTTGKLDLTIGGSSVVIADKAIGNGAENARFVVGGPAAFKSAEQISINGDHIVLEATGSLTLKSSALEIAMTPSATAFKGKVRLKSGSVIKVAGNPDNLTK